MLIGPDQIIACPHCKGLARYMPLRTGNTLGIRVWTDGKQVAPMLPRPPAVVKCGHCGECYWLADADEVGIVQPWGLEDGQVDPAWAAAEGVQEPAEEEYYWALEKGLATDALQERELRILAWWRRNDAFRADTEAPASCTPTASAKYRQKLEALASLLDNEDERDRFIRAEALRELGQFEAAKQLLSRVTSRRYAALVRQLQSLCDRGDTGVREFQLPSPRPTRGCLAVMIASAVIGIILMAGGVAQGDRLGWLGVAVGALEVGGAVWIGIMLRRWGRP